MQYLRFCMASTGPLEPLLNELLVTVDRRRKAAAGGQKAGGRQNKDGTGKMEDGRASAGHSEQSDLPVGCAAVAGIGHE
jgi:hypothetical protein